MASYVLTSAKRAAEVMVLMLAPFANSNSDHSFKSERDEKKTRFAIPSVLACALGADNLL